MKRKGFTLIELIAVLIILSILSLVVVPLMLNIIRNAKNSANKRSIDGYGRAVDLAIANYLVEHLTYPDTFDKLEIEYSGSKVECKTSRINPDETVYLSECKVNGRLVKDNNEIDGYYHYGTLKMTNQEYVDTYGKNLEDALKTYHDEHNEYPTDYTILEIPNLDKEVSCDVKINCDGTVKLTSCKVDNEDVYENDTQEYYVYGETPLATTCLLLKTNSKSITTYTDGNTHEMYTFDHEAASQTPALTDYRYIGNEPYNYVKFNGDETWRIIGIFDTDDGTGKYEKRIKLIRNEMLNSVMMWSSNYNNEWKNSILNNYLNDDYYNVLSNSSKSLIKESKYYLGGGNTSYENVNQYYSWERGISVINGNSLYWIGNIALMYPSDYIYSFPMIDSCYNNVAGCRYVSSQGWIFTSSSNSHQWLLMPSSENERNSFYIYYMGSLSCDSVRYELGVRPTLYLSSRVKIKSGDGTIDNPYEFEL